MACFIMSRSSRRGVESGKMIPDLPPALQDGFNLARAPLQPSHGGVPIARPRLYRVCLVAGVTALALIATAAFRSTTGAFFQLLEDEFGWHRSGLSTAVMVNQVI